MQTETKLQLFELVNNWINQRLKSIEMPAFKTILVPSLRDQGAPHV